MLVFVTGGKKRKCDLKKVAPHHRSSETQAVTVATSACSHIPTEMHTKSEDGTQVLPLNFTSQSK